MYDAIKDKATRIDPKSWNGGLAEQQNGRKGPQIILRGIAEDDPKSLNTERRKMIPNPNLEYAVN